MDQARAFVKGAISYPKDVVRTVVTAGSVVCEGSSIACAKNVRNSRRIGGAIHDYYNDPVIQPQIFGRATVVTIVGTAGGIGFSLNAFAITGGALRASETEGDVSDLVSSALGVDLE